MKRWWILGLLVAAGLAVGLYRAKLGAQENETRITALNSQIRKTNDEVSVLKAEETYLSRPERIGPMAREKLGLQPAQPSQFTAPEMISKRVAEEKAAQAAATPTPAPVKSTPVKAKPVAATGQAAPAPEVKAQQ